MSFFKNLRVAWYCPELRWDMFLYYVLKVIHITVSIPYILALIVPSVINLLSERLTDLLRWIWSGTGANIYALRQNRMNKVRSILSVNEIRRRIGKLPYDDPSADKPEDYRPLRWT